jgi:8-oxo-dGTP diphosphatase
MLGRSLSACAEVAVALREEAVDQAGWAVFARLGRLVSGTDPGATGNQCRASPAGGGCGSTRGGLMDDGVTVDLRCSAVLFRGERVLLLRRHRNGREDWVLPGGNPRPGEGTANCVRREVEEETGLQVDVAGVAFVLEIINPTRTDRLIEVVFLAADRAPRRAPRAMEPGLEPAFVALDDLPGLDLRPRLGGYLRGLHRARIPATAAYLGNLWQHPRESLDGGTR